MKVELRVEGKGSGEKKTNCITGRLFVSFGGESYAPAGGGIRHKSQAPTYTGGGHNPVRQRHEVERGGHIRKKTSNQTKRAVYLRPNKEKKRESKIC